MLRANLNGEVQFYRVGRQVNAAKTEDGSCIQPVNPL